MRPARWRPRRRCRRAFLFDPGTSTFTATAELNTGRFYPTTLTMADGRPMTLLLPMDLPAARRGPVHRRPTKPARRFDPAANPVVDNPALQYNQLANPQRGTNMDGTAVLLPLKPPNYEPRVLVAGGTSNGAAWSASEAGALQTAEWIDLSVAAPAWQALPNMNIARDHVNSALLPDGKVLIVGGVEMPPDGGPAEIFDPQDPGSGFLLGPNMATPGATTPPPSCYRTAASSSAATPTAATRPTSVTCPHTSSSRARPSPMRPRPLRTAPPPYRKSC
jgi:hypothetical protein